jgi:hypothetical protein
LIARHNASHRINYKRKSYISSLVKKLHN